MAEALEFSIGKALRAKGWTLALGESCTGGLVGHRITNVPGASEYLLGAIVSYSNEAKERLLGVHPDTLNQHGAVSQETALEMARGARRVLNADVGLSVTGIAGPDVGMPNKPVGLTWMAVCTVEGEWTEEHIWKGDRESNKAESAEAALALLLKVLEGKL